MAVPDFQYWFTPLLRLIEDGEIHLMSEVYERLADGAELSLEDRSELLPSGKQFTYRNRIGWARTYLKKAGLVSSPARGEVRISPHGQKLLESLPESLNLKYLKENYESFKEFHEGSSAVERQDDGSSSDTISTPEESLERIHRGIQRQLEQDLLEQIMQAPPEFFEKVVVELLQRMGYGGAREDSGYVTEYSKDGGIDGVINEDALGLDSICIQAKRWASVVGRPDIQAFAGSLEGVRARKGVFITTSHFSAEARQYVNQIEKRIVLIDGPRLAELMVANDLGVSTARSYEIKKIDTDYFSDE